MTSIRESAGKIGNGRVSEAIWAYLLSLAAVAAPAIGRKGWGRPDVGGTLILGRMVLLRERAQAALNPCPLIVENAASSRASKAASLVGHAREDKKMKNAHQTRGTSGSELRVSVR